MMLPTAYFLALLFFQTPRAVENQLLIPCSKEWFLDYEVPNATDCITGMPANDANLTKYGPMVVPLELIDASSRSEIFNMQRWGNSLFCCFISRPYCPTMRWFKDGKEINSKYQLDNFEIKKGGRVLNLLPSLYSNGNYSCTATTPYGEVESHTMKVQVQLPCKGVAYLNPDPKTKKGVIEVIRGTSRTLTCQFFCGKGLSREVWRNGKGELIVKDDPNYILASHDRTDDDNPYSPDHVETLTIVNFTKSENITCIRKQNSRSINTTFHLVPKECFGTPEIIQTPGGQDVIPVAKGSNKTFTCQFFCLEKKNFGNFTWMFGNGQPIPNNNLKYKSVKGPVDTNELSFGRRRLNYEMSLTIMNISKIEIFSCNHSSPNEGQSDSKTFRLHVQNGANQIPVSTEGFFKRAGTWIVIGVLLAMLVFFCFLSFWFRRTINKWLKFLGFGRISKPIKNAQYDAFISYCETDGGPFVRSSLVPMLERQCGYKLCLRCRDFPAGAAIVDNTVQCIDASRKILLVITHGFLNSQWRTYEMEQGVLRSVFKPNTLMVIMLNEIPRTELPLKLQRFVDKTSYLVWDDSKSDKMCEKIKTKLGSPLTVKNQGTSGNSKESTWQQCNSYV